LPFSANPPQTDDILARIENLTQKLGLDWGGADNKDALAPQEGYVNATTNCADPHAMIGNEGRYGSIDAMLSTNADLACFNPAYNDTIQVRTSPSCISIAHEDAINQIKIATNKYLKWMDENATGFRFNHLYHGND